MFSSVRPKLGLCEYVAKTRYGTINLNNSKTIKKIANIS